MIQEGVKFFYENWAVIVRYIIVIPVASMFDLWVRFSDSENAIKSGVSRLVIGATLAYVMSPIIMKSPNEFIEIMFFAVVSNGMTIAIYLRNKFLNYTKREIDKKLKEEKK